MLVKVLLEASFSCYWHPMYTKLFNTLTTNDLVLTANRRLSAYLRERYTQHQQQKAIWDSLQILPFTSWLEHCWEESLLQQAAPLQLLTSVQEQYIWEQIIRNAVTEDLIHFSATAAKARQAWQLCQQWQIDVNQADFSHSENTRPWQHWAQQFTAYCQEHRWLDSATLSDWLCEHYFPTAQLPARIFVVGFDELNPQYQRLVRQLRQQQVVVEEINYQQAANHVIRTALPDPNQELLAMAQWAHQLWQQGATKIGCIAPNLTELRADVVQVFTEVFCPETLLPGHYVQSKTLPFNISAGQTLQNFALIDTALRCLQLHEYLEFNTISALLRSPYLGYAEQELILRASIDKQLARGEDYLTLQKVIVTAKQLGSNKLASQLQNFQQLLQLHQKSKLFPHEWAVVFSRLLTALGWPGERSLDSTEYQLIESWGNILSTFAHLSQVTPQLNYTQAVQQLKQLIATQDFQAQSGEHPVHILGILEAAGVEFNHLWVMGLHDNTWPTAAKPNPFIPIALQRRLQLPHSSSQRELEYCKQITKRLQNSAANVIFSYPEYHEDRPLRPSPLINDIDCIAYQKLITENITAYPTIIYQSQNIEMVTDVQASVLSTTEIEKLTGGASLLKDQAACPFRAFARFRLGAQRLDIPSSGLNSQQRGSILHHALEIVWHKIISHEYLCQLSPSELQTIISDAVNEALVYFIKQKPLTFRQRFTAIEKKRLHKLLFDWLELEKQRAPFRIYSVEKTIHFNLAGIPLQLRSDRIDQLQDNSYFIIDYKTGNLSDPDWFGERPREPQLPLYCISSELNISGIALAQVQAAEKKFKGLSALEDPGIKGVNALRQQKDTTQPQHWQDLLIHWQRVLTELATQFQQGHAAIDPYEGTKTCQFCDLPTLCRIQK